MFYALDRVAKKAWRFRASQAWYVKHDNGHAISIGFSVPDEITHRQLSSLKAKEVSWETWNHSGCHSGCTLRGDAKCRW